MAVPEVYEPRVVFVLQGAKEVNLGASRLLVDRLSYLVVPVSMPVSSRVISASPARPYLSIKLQVDRLAAAELLAGAPNIARQTNCAPAYTAPLEGDLLDALIRLVRHARSGGVGSVPYSLARREVLYWVLSGPLAPFLRRVLAPGAGAEVVQYHKLLRLQAAHALLASWRSSVSVAAREVGYDNVSQFCREFKRLFCTSPSAVRP